MDLSGLFSSTSSGGTISFTGTTPNGAFHGDTVNVMASYGALTGVVVSIGDSQSGWGFEWSYNWPPPDGGALLNLLDAVGIDPDPAYLFALWAPVLAGVGFVELCIVRRPHRRNSHASKALALLAARLRLAVAGRPGGFDNAA